MPIGVGLGPRVVLHVLKFALPFPLVETGKDDEDRISFSSLLSVELGVAAGAVSDLVILDLPLLELSLHPADEAGVEGFIFSEIIPGLGAGLDPAEWLRSWRKGAIDPTLPS